MRYCRNGRWIVVRGRVRLRRVTIFVSRIVDGRSVVIVDRVVHSWKVKRNMLHPRLGWRKLCERCVEEGASRQWLSASCNKWVSVVIGAWQRRGRVCTRSCVINLICERFKWSRTWCTRGVMWKASCGERLRWVFNMLQVSSGWSVKERV